ncbi:MAG: sodium ion-translocating decarboxylase subunit beta [Paludibacteraceae bacterium]|nr:sodium ion-translocating decarboxylase subunit beta [Paludibacteraceae bacterium]
MEEILEKIYQMTAFGNIAAEPGFLIMYALAFVLLYLGIKKGYEPLLLVPIAFGVLIANFPGGDMGVLGANGQGEIFRYLLDNGSWQTITLEGGVDSLNGIANPELYKQVGQLFYNTTENPLLNEASVMNNLKVYEVYEMSLPAIAHELGLMNFIYYMLIKTGFIPPIIFMGVGALTDFGPMLRNLKLAIFGAGAQFGIFAVLLIAAASGFFTMQEAASLSIIGGADGPTAIYTTIKLAPHLLGPIAIAAYSYMALVPVIVPLVVNLTCSKKELSINMKEQDKLYPSKQEFKNMRVLKILFPIVTTVIVAILVPTAVSLVGMLMFGNLIKEIGSSTNRIHDAASNGIMNAATIFLGLSVGATMTVDAFLNFQTIGIVIGGFFAFGFSIFGGIMLVKLFNLFSKKKINPLVGATGLSAVPMAARVANEIALKYDPKNHVLNYCMSSNVSGVIGSAVAAGILISFLG